MTCREGQVRVFDLGSTNGTYVNGVKVKEAELEEGQVLKLGQCELRLVGEEKLESAAPKTIERFCGMVGASVEMRELYGLLERVAPTEAGVLILGESGTGKELVSRALHYNSLRWDKPFVVENCAAMPSELLESELSATSAAPLPTPTRTRRASWNTPIAGPSS